MRKKRKHPLIGDNPSGKLPKRAESQYISELFERSRKAIEKLKRLLD